MCARAEAKLRGALITSGGDASDGGQRGDHRDHCKRSRPNNAAIARTVVKPARNRRCSTWWCISPTDRDRIRHSRPPAHSLRIAWIGVTVAGPVTVCRRSNAADHGTRDQSSGDTGSEAASPPAGFGGLGAARALRPSTAAVAKTSAVFFTSRILVNSV